MTTKKGLGRGLEALLSVYDEQEDDVQTQTPKAEQKKTEGVNEIDMGLVYANPNQPRKNFDKTALEELANSIKVHGVIQPIIVNQDVDGKYMIIAGERRWRASKLIDAKTIPAIVKNYTEKQVKEISIIENLQREDLNPIEAAKAIKTLMEEYGLTQEVVAERIGISRPNIANTLRLLTLAPEVIALVENNKLSAGHARCLVVIADQATQIRYAYAAADNKLTVRDLEKAVKNYLKPKNEKTNKDIQPSLETRELINEMQRVFATKVSLIGNDKKGRIYIDYYSRDDLDRIIELVETLKNKTLTLKDLSNFNKRKDTFDV